MLQKEAVEPGTLELIRKISADERFRDFALAGGTALALYLGHRTSVDIDLFSLHDFDTEEMMEYLESRYGFSVQYRAKNTLKGFVKGVFTDLISHQYPLAGPQVQEEGCRLYSLPDITAMKVNAISGDGTRIKDFIDIYFLLKKYTLAEIISFYTRKYGLHNEFHAVKSLGYFGDLDPDPAWPVLLKEKDLTLEKIKENITIAISRYLESNKNG